MQNARVRRPVDDALAVGEQIAGWCTRLVAAVPRGVAAAGSPTGRPILLAFALGGLLVGVSFAWYSAVAPPPTPPAVDGAGEVYVDDPAIAVGMRVEVAPDVAHTPGRRPIRITLILRGPPSAAQQQARKVGWALVLYRDARFAAGTVRPAGVAVDENLLGNPPFDRTAAAVREPVQVVHGIAHLTVLENSAQAVVVTGELGKEVFARSGPRLALSLPRYGRTDLNTGFSFATAPDAFDIGLPGDWSPPTDLQVQVDAGPNGPGQRIDSASPDVVDPATLTWRDDDALRVNLLRTDLAEEAAAQRTTFMLGAVVGAGAASILSGVERLLTLRRRAGPGRPARRGPEDRPERAEPGPGS